MKRTRFLSGILALSMLPVVPVEAAEPPTLIDASGFSVHDENLVYIGADYLNPASVLFDEQDKVPHGVTPPFLKNFDSSVFEHKANWKPNWQPEFGEDSFYIDLGANYLIDGIGFLDTNGVQEWKVEYGEPFNWQELTSFTTDSYNAWRSHSLFEPQETRYLRFSTAAGDSGIAELALYGNKISSLSEKQREKTAAHPSTTRQVKLSAGQQIGFNAFIDDPMTAIMAGGNVREYHNLSWLFDEDGKIKFTQGSWGDMDSYYAAMKKMGISIIPCFQGNSPYIFGESKYPEIAVKKGADTLDPESYALHAQAMYQVAARYGSNSDIDKKTLNVAEGSEPAVGLGLLDALENANEPNKSWAGKASYYSPYELAAMCSADYDGHEGRIQNAGVKQADPNFRLAVGGLLAGGGLLDYLTNMKLWFDYNRTDGVFAVDIINIHLGPDTYNPEDSDFMKRIAEIQLWISQNAPYTELWISEFEVPMDDCETEGVDNHDNETYQLRYAQRVARTYLMAFAADVERMTKFQLRDEGEGVYYNSGLTTGKGEWSKKLAWYYTACMTNTLRNTYFAADLTQDEVKKYFFINNTNGDSIYALWLPSSEGKEIKDYKLTVPSAANVYLTVPGEYAEGTVSELPVIDSKVTLDISETPVFVTVAAAEKTVINGRGQYLTPKTIALSADFSGETCTTENAPTNKTLNQFFRMFDESKAMPQFIYGDTKDLTDPETNVNQSGIKGYVQLAQPCVLTGFSVFDTYGTGKISVFDAKTDTLLWSSDLGSYMCRSTDFISDSAPTDLLRIEKEGGDLNELALYGYPAQPTASEALRGDVNCDKQITVADAVLLARIVAEDKTAKVTDQGLANADCNGNGVSDTEDTTLVLKALAGLVKL